MATAHLFSVASMAQGTATAAEAVIAAEAMPIAAEEMTLVAGIAAEEMAAAVEVEATSNQTEQPISLSQNLMLHRREHPKGGSA
jgi:hypothetical protein